MNKYNVTGDEIVTLLGRSETDDKILDLFEKLEIDSSEIERDEDIDSFDIELEEDIGLTLTFDASLKEESCVPKYIGGQYLVQATFEYRFKPLPFGLDDEYNLETVITKLGEEPNYINIDNSSELYWFYEDLGWLSIEFEDESLTSIYYVDVKPFENPLEDWDGENGFNTIMKAFKR